MLKALLPSQKLWISPPLKDESRIESCATYEVCWSLFKCSIVCEKVPVPPSLRHPPVDPACPPFLKSLFLLLSFLFHPLLRYFRQFPHLHTTSCPNPTHQPSLHTTNEFQQISKGWLYRFSYRFISKINFCFFKSLWYISLS